MSKLKLNLIGVFASLVLMTPSFSHAEDWTYSAYNKCRVYNQIGELTQWGTGQMGKSDYSLVFCPLVKEVANIALTYVNVAVEKRSAGSDKPIACTLVQSSSLDSLYNSMASAETRVVGKKLLSMTAPTTLYNYSGYAGVLCGLYKDDIIYGVRYKQVN